MSYSIAKRIIRVRAPLTGMLASWLTLSCSGVEEMDVAPRVEAGIQQSVIGMDSIAEYVYEVSGLPTVQGAVVCATGRGYLLGFQVYQGVSAQQGDEMSLLRHLFPDAMNDLLENYVRGNNLLQGLANHYEMTCGIQVQRTYSLESIWSRLPTEKKVLQILGVAVGQEAREAVLAYRVFEYKAGAITYFDHIRMDSGGRIVQIVRHQYQSLG
jgi:hypothetical protein